MARNAKASEDFSTPIEEEVSAPFKAIGTAEWLEKSFEKGALLKGEAISVTRPSDLGFFKKFLMDTKERAMDTETSGPMKEEDDDKNYNMNPLNEGTEMVIFQVGNKDITYLVEPKLLPHFKAELESPNHLNVLHNALYDWRWLFVKYNVHLVNMYCTMLAEQVSTAGLTGYRYSLQDVSRRRAKYLISKAVRDEFINYKGYMTRNMCKYGSRDCKLLFDIKDDQMLFLEKMGLLDIAQLEFDIIPCTAELELDGINLDLQIINIIISYWLQKEKEVGAEILDLYDSELKRLGKGSDFLFDGLKDVFNLNSNHAKLKALSEMGFDLDDVKRETLKETDHKLAKLLAEYSGITKKTSTYGQNMVDRINQFTHKWHPKFNQIGAGESSKSGKEDKAVIATGRYSGDSQQFPRPEELYCKATPEEYKWLTNNFKDKINEARERCNN